MNDMEQKVMKESSQPSASSFFIVVSAPSGTGKTSICREFLKNYPEVRFSVSSTTRAPRPGEKNGVDYFFISEETFRKKIEEGAFSEWVKNYDHYYGTTRAFMQDTLDSGRNLLLDVEPEGAKALKKNYPGGVFVFILPPTLDDLKKRLNQRGEAPETVQKRFDKAVDEIREIMCYDYIIVNQNLEDAINCLRSIYVAEKCRRERSMEKIGALIG